MRRRPAGRGDVAELGDVAGGPAPGDQGGIGHRNWASAGTDENNEDGAESRTGAGHRAARTERSPLLRRPPCRRGRCTLDRL